VMVPRKPRTVTDCNCSICRRYGVLWAYHKAATVRVEAAPKALHRYAWGPKSQHFSGRGFENALQEREPHLDAFAVVP
jgi:hypothetical protein